MVCRTDAVGLFWEKGEKAGKNRFLCDGLSANEHTEDVIGDESAVGMEQQSIFVN